MAGQRHEYYEIFDTVYLAVNFDRSHKDNSEQHTGREKR